MTNRLTRIYTRTGDKGTTGLADGSRVSKTSERIETLGDIDELNSVLGILRTELANDDALAPVFFQVQNDLFDLGGEIAMANPEYQAITPAIVTELENHLDALNEQLPPLTEFILPGGSRSAAYCHQARSICRRAERQMIRLCDAEDQNPMGAVYLNRLSDLLFVCARILARRNGNQEICWQPRHK
ncbi:cob(I)yrinic acid a,c-diamide adenosyltransferase [Neptunomonas antarctica]|uniref:Corrinoid adenosyltransferase n=1 Tax=Neptunomonas antarctica TaxID=619304 RepID=A0A1N7LZG4_9GAMM|nr:cob(I)yrinic acid a,c-diamide adenosyltransferase [Neptunomonas antarctica]SIS79207.1 cob(I)alamin adenosyltransferase [Neptunomonas antarctica]